MPLADIFNHRCQKVPKNEAVPEIGEDRPAAIGGNGQVKGRGEPPSPLECNGALLQIGLSGSS